jgi:hypothetical protein
LARALQYRLTRFGQRADDIGSPDRRLDGAGYLDFHAAAGAFGQRELAGLVGIACGLPH